MQRSNFTSYDILYYQISDILMLYAVRLNGYLLQRSERDGDLQSQARIRLSKDELRTDILSGHGRWQLADGRWQMTDD